MDNSVLTTEAFGLKESDMTTITIDHVNNNITTGNVCTSSFQGTSVSGDGGISITGDQGIARTEDLGMAIAGRSGMAVAGYAGIAMTTLNGQAMADEDGILVFKIWEENDLRLHVFYVGEGGIKANTAYKYEDGKAVEVK